MQDPSATRAVAEQDRYETPATRYLPRQCDTGCNADIAADHSVGTKEAAARLSHVASSRPASVDPIYLAEQFGHNVDMGPGHAPVPDRSTDLRLIADHVRAMLRTNRQRQLLRRYSTIESRDHAAWTAPSRRRESSSSCEVARVFREQMAPSLSPSCRSTLFELS